MGLWILLIDRFQWNGVYSKQIYQDGELYWKRFDQLIEKSTRSSITLDEKQVDNKHFLKNTTQTAYSLRRGYRKISDHRA